MDHMVDHIFAFEGDGIIKDYYGNYSEYHRLKKIQEQIKKPKIVKEKTATDKPKLKANKFTYKQQKEFESIEAEIKILEAEKNDILVRLNKGSGTPEEFQSWSSRYAELIEVIDLKTDRWLELSELMDDSL